MNEFAVLLDQGVPEPQAFLDPEALLRRAHRRQTVRLSGALAATVAVVVVVGVAMWAPGQRRPLAAGAPVSPTLSALDDAVALPTSLSGEVGPVGAQPHQPTGLGVTAIHHGQTTVYLAAATGDGVCLLLENSNGSGVESCRAIADLTTRPLYVVMDSADGRPVQTAIVMPDGYTTLTLGSDTATAAFNVAYLPAMTSTHCVISGPHVESRQVDLGPDPLPPARAGSSPQPSAPTGPVSAVPVRSAVADLRYPVNVHGMTYGSLAVASTHGGKAPDLIAASGLDNTGAHVDGYFKHADMPVQAEPKNPADAAALMAKAVPAKTIPLYAVDGTTVIGTFTFAGRAAAATGTATAH
jgi:hypothetical protein